MTTTGDKGAGGAPGTNDGPDGQKADAIGLESTVFQARK